MRIEFLGTGGATTTPRAGSRSEVSNEARIKGVPYSRMGPSIFVHGPDILIDTPEEIGLQLNRAGITYVPHVLYSHWHPDHTAGRRVFEMNEDHFYWPPRRRCTDVYLPEQVAVDFGRFLGLREHFAFLVARNEVRVHTVADGETLTFGDITVQPIRLFESYVYAFLFRWDKKRVLIAMDELHGWQPDEPELIGVDLAILPAGLFDIHPLTGQRQIPPEHPVLKAEAMWEDTLKIVERLQPKRTIFTHIEEPDNLSYDDLRTLAGRSDHRFEFAYDTLQVAIA